jgi:hypothetical protein
MKRWKARHARSAVRGIRLAICGALMVAGAGSRALAQEAVEPASGKVVSYGRLDRLPDWRGIWTPLAPPFFMGPPEPIMKGHYKEVYDRIWGELKKGNSDAAELRSDSCEPPAMPAVMIQPYNIEFLFTPGRVTVIQEAYMQVRRIFTDGRPLPESPDPTFNGSSIGHWDGNTLVVTTVGLKDGKGFGFPGAIYSDELKITERIHLVEGDEDKLVIDFTFEDPKALVEPWKRSITFGRHREWDQVEFVCAENNRNPLDEKGGAHFLPPGQ